MADPIGHFFTWHTRHQELEDSWVWLKYSGWYSKVTNCNLDPAVQPTSNAPVQPPVVSQAMRLAAIFYDLDGTLVNSDPIHYRAWQEALQIYGIQINETFYKTRISGGLNPAIAADLLPHLSPDAQQQVCEQKEARFRELAPQLTRPAGLSEVLAWANQRGLKQAVVTNAPPKNVHHLLQALDLDATFDRVVLAEELGIGKPDPAPYQYALRQLDLLPEQVIAFEDSPTGVISAVKAGITTVGIASTQEPHALYTVGASLVIPDFTAPELQILLAQRF